MSKDPLHDILVQMGMAMPDLSRAELAEKFAAQAQLTPEIYDTVEEVLLMAADLAQRGERTCGNNAAAAVTGLEPDSAALTNHPVFELAGDAHAVTITAAEDDLIPDNPDDAEGRDMSHSLLLASAALVADLAREARGEGN